MQVSDWQPKWSPGELQRRLGVTDARAGFMKDLKRALEGPTPDDRAAAAAAQVQQDQELLAAYRWAQQQERARAAQPQSGPASRSVAEVLGRELAGRSAAGEVWSNTDGLANQAANVPPPSQ